MDELSKYHSQGMAERARLVDGGGVDPIWSVWVYKPVTVPGLDGRDQM